MLTEDRRAIVRARELLLKEGVAIDRLACPHVIERHWLWGRRILFRNVRAEAPRCAVVNVGRFFGRAWIDWTWNEDLSFDPQEEDPRLAEQFLEADALALSQTGLPRGEGLCHRYWDHKKKILKERFGIEWKDPRELNPGVRFD